MHILLPVFLLFHSTPAHAGGGFVAGSVNLLIFVGILFVLVRKPLQKMLKRRANTIKRELEEAQQQLEEAKAHNIEVEKKLENINAQIDDLRKEADVQIERMREEFASKALNDIEAIKENAKRTVEDEILRAKELLKKETTQKSIELAKEMLKSQINNEDQSRLFQSFTKAVEESSHVQ